jgi:hypothetical protein
MMFPDKCVLWDQREKRDGYAIVMVGGMRHKGRRYFYELFVGPIPKGGHVLHTCDQRACVNPAHLRIGTHAQNMADMKAKGRSTHGEKNHHAKLTPDLVREIRASKETLQVLSDRMGLGKSAIWSARVGQTWTRVK